MEASPIELKSDLDHMNIAIYDMLSYNLYYYILSQVLIQKRYKNLDKNEYMLKKNDLEKFISLRFFLLNRVLDGYLRQFSLVAILAALSDFSN